MRILITGAGGFIGLHLLRRLQGRHEIFALDLDAGEALPGVEWIAQNLAEPLDPRALPETVDAVIHLAQSRYYRQFPEQAGDITAINVLSTARLLEYARGAGAARFLFASTGSIYGTGDAPLVESAPITLPSFYARSKYAAEVLVEGYQSLFRTIIFRFFTVYGPGQRGMLVPTLAQRVLAGEAVTVDGNPGLRLTPTYVDDAARAIEAALTYPDSLTVNIAGDEDVSITDLVRMIAEAVGKPENIVHKDTPPPGNALGDNTRMKTLLGVAPETALREGLAATIGAMKSK